MARHCQRAEERIVGGEERSKVEEKNQNRCLDISANLARAKTTRVYARRCLVVLAHYPMPTYSTVINCRQVVRVVTASQGDFSSFYLKMTSGMIGLVSTSSDNKKKNERRAARLFMRHNVMK